MPFTINGFGTTLCPARGHLSWHKKGSSDATDYDAVECICAIYMPLIPFRAIHVFGKDSEGTGYQYQQIPIRWSLGLVARAFLNRWLWVPCIGSLILAIIFISEVANKKMEMDLDSVSGIGAFVFTFVLSILTWWGMRRLDSRTKNIRRVMGPSILGSSDPVTWKNDLLDQAASPQELFECSTFEQAVPKMLTNEEYGRAMLAARLCSALEDKIRGEELTNEVLNDPYVYENLPDVHRDPTLWPHVFGKGIVEEQLIGSDMIDELDNDQGLL